MYAIGAASPIRILVLSNLVYPPALSLKYMNKKLIRFSLKIIMCFEIYVMLALLFCLYIQAILQFQGHKSIPSYIVPLFHNIRHSGGLFKPTKASYVQEQR
jgi:hypothetical protein